METKTKLIGIFVHVFGIFKSVQLNTNIAN